jgi:hypothetical protein
MRAALAAPLLLGAALCRAQGSAQDRANQFKELAAEMHHEPGDPAPAILTQKKFDDLLSRMRGIVQEEVLDTLNRTDKPEDARAAVRSLLGEDPYRNKELPYVYSSNLQGLKVVVVGYYITPDSGPEVMIDGFRKAGLTYELAAETGGSLSLCILRLDQLDSPRSNEAWFLARGPVVMASRAVEKLSIYSFDGYEFKGLWNAAGVWRRPEIKITQDTITVVHYDDNDTEQPVYKDTIRLTTGGLVVSTITLQQ